MTEKKKSWLIWGALVVLIAVSGFLGIAFPIPVPPIPSASSQGFIYPPGAIYIEAGGKNQVFSSGTLQTFKSGSSLTADAGSTVSLLGTNVFAVPTFSGNVTVNGNSLVTGTLIVSGTSTLVGATTATGVISANGGISGTLATAAQPNITSVGTLPLATITKLTATDITGTLATAAQPNITSLGTVPTATITKLTATDITGTLATAAQPNITSLGTVPTATITKLNSTNITATTFAGNVAASYITSTNDVLAAYFKPSAGGSASAVNYCNLSDDCDTGQYSISANVWGLATGGVERLRVSVAGLSGDNATFTTLTVTNLISTAVGFDTTGDGTVALPAYTFASDPNTGLYRVGENDIGVTTNGILALDVSASAVTLALPITSNGDLTFGVGNTTATIAPATQAEGTAGNAVAITGGQAGVAATGAAGKNGGAVTITGGLGTDKDAGGTPSGNGGDVVLVGGAKGGSTSNVTGIVKVGSPSVQSTKAVDVLAVGGVLEVDGATRMDGNLSVTAGTITGPAEGSVVYNLMVDATAAEIQSGHILVTVPAARIFRLVDVTAVAYGATCTTSTVMSLTATSDLVVYTTANLVRSTTLRTTTTGVALLDDGASFSAQAAGADLIVKDDSGNTGGCTGVRFVINYALD